MTNRFGEFVLDSEARLLLRGDRSVHLTPKAFALLQYLVERRPTALSKERVLGHLWPATFVSEANLASLVHEIREALSDDAHESRFVRTVHGYGYAFCAAAQDDDGLPGEPAGRDAEPARAERTREFRLLWQRRELSLDEGNNILGRTHEAALWVDHPSVSRRHAVIRITDGSAWLEDCGSKHGTFLGGERIAAPRPLSDGDTICLGEAVLVFRVFEPATTSETGTEDG